MNTSNPGIGLVGCKTIYHVYPVDEQGQYLSNGTFTFDRETQEYITGVIFAPRGMCCSFVQHFLCFLLIENLIFILNNSNYHGWPLRWISRSIDCQYI